MPDVDKIMRSPRLKVERAQSHIQDLISLSSPLSKDLHEVVFVQGRSVAVLAQPDCIDLVYKPKKPIAEFFALIMGDAIHNLRSALDHWAAAFVSDVTGNPRDTRVYFPFWGKCQDPKSAKGYVSIEKASPETAKFIRDTIKPYPDGNVDLYSVTDLDNIDKHNFILPTINMVSIAGINATIGNDIIENCKIGGDATRQIHLIRSNRMFYVENNFKTTVDITFPKGSTFENQPVIPTLANLAKITSQSLNSLESFCRTIT